MPKDAQLGALNLHSPPGLYVLYLTRQPTEHPLPPGSMLYVLYVVYLTRQPTEHPLPPGSLLYVLYVRRLSLAHEAPRHPSATFALVLVVPHPVKALQQFCFGHTRACVAELAGNQNVVAAVEDGSGLVPHEILVLRLGGPWQQEGGYLRLRLLRLRLLRLALLARLPLQVQVNGLARRLRLHGRSVRGGFAAIQPLCSKFVAG